MKTDEAARIDFGAWINVSKTVFNRANSGWGMKLLFIDHKSLADRETLNCDTFNKEVLPTKKYRLYSWRNKYPREIYKQSGITHVKDDEK